MFALLVLLTMYHVLWQSRRNLAHVGSVEDIIFSIWFCLFAARCSAEGKRSARHLKTAFKVLHRLRQNGLYPERYIYELVIEACGSSGRPEKAVKVLHEMEVAGQSPDASTYSALLQTFFMNGDPTLGYQALSEFQQRTRQKMEKKKPAVKHADSSSDTETKSPGTTFTTKHFEHSFPGLTLHTKESCPECNKLMTDR